MKKSILVFLIFLLSGSICLVYSQVRLDYTARSGLNFTGFHGSDLTSDRKTSPKKGMTIGISTSISYSHFPINLVNLETGLLFSQKGITRDHIIMDAPVGYQRQIYRIDYFEVPLIAKFRLADTFDFGPYIFAGGYLGMNINAKDVRKDFESTKDDLEFVERWENGILAGIGSDFMIMQRKIDVRLTFSRGASNTFETRPGRNQALSFSIGFGL